MATRLRQAIAQRYWAMLLATGDVGEGRLVELCMIRMTGARDGGTPASRAVHAPIAARF